MPMAFKAQEYIKEKTILEPEARFCNSAGRLDRLIKQLEEGIRYCRNEIPNARGQQRTEYLEALYTLEQHRDSCRR